jgi:putative FmdB family regulatory protein
MPIYEYRCENEHTFEVTQRMTDEPLTSCPTCGARVERVFHPVAVHFKGSGFYSTDYGKKKAGAAADGSKPEGKESGKQESASKESASKESASKESASEHSGSKDSGPN